MRLIKYQKHSLHIFIGIYAAVIYLLSAVIIPVLHIAGVILPHGHGNSHTCHHSSLNISGGHHQDTRSGKTELIAASPSPHSDKAGGQCPICAFTAKMTGISYFFNAAEIISVRCNESYNVNVAEIASFHLHSNHHSRAPPSKWISQI